MEKEWTLSRNMAKKGGNVRVVISLSRGIERTVILLMIA
jgi:hypothetical protein